MYTLLRTLPLSRLASEQLPALAISWVIAEVFFKFGSFTLECAAFLVTWFVLDAAIQIVRRALLARDPARSP